MPHYPYISGQNALRATFDQLRRGFPPTVDAGYLRRFNIAPANESYVISILKFLNLIDDDGNKIDDNTAFFFGDEETFKKGLEAAVRTAYAPLINEMGDEALTAERSKLVHWFRASDRTTELVGTRQASTFQTLAALAGHGELPARAAAPKKAAKRATAPAKKVAAKKSATPRKPTAEQGGGSDSGRGDGGAANGQSVGLTVRIEVNLPPGGDAGTYDAIFASIKKHLMP